jgi:hypothetical protein
MQMVQGAVSSGGFAGALPSTGWLVLAVDANIMRGIEHAGILIGMHSAGAAFAPGLDPVAVFVELGDARVDVAVADIDVVIGVERNVGGSAEVSIYVRKRWKH